MRLLLLDNYDSFTYNLLELFRADSRVQADVRRNDQISVDEAGDYDVLVFSPGPGLPHEAGNLLSIIDACADRIPMFGVCLGLQAMALTFGAELYNLNNVCHGISSTIHVEQPGDPLFTGVPGNFEAGRYHSWAIDNATVPECLQTIARDQNGVIMAARHVARPIYGVQFHPESIMSPVGNQLVTNFLRYIA